ncbi:hypothetical protein LTR10_016438 [Elasticomyces elasticus]|uniref:DUF7730 domain-containing protein n=1 Tax=Exophiala sideris TaxID=1016849 RepID=A0ABR0JCG6_9EURO|nr:hypothetical protein LTR10_016438 [Elasticomyces elasticus]KAK5031174.1 hypothetical protein LTS07_004909 [Exophiala sideris]KAK5038895.1 hypothetical protein LTR13_003926 [Exophiala sideris]KAK5060779.1 hypothetical protein LTR69_005378 [Exophiala sideris]KAK5183691.1 hypothetical protein LTR44_003973 [Eurotiomycetes sp. CCFEE 6388]
MSSLDSTTPVHSPFLNLPTEIRLKIYTHLFSFPDPIKIEPAHPTSQAAFIFDSNTNEAKETPWLLRQPTTSGLTSQLLRTCRKIHHESLPVLYQSNIFDCSAREGVPLLQHNIGPSSFSLIRHVILDWEQLQDFAWSLAKPEHQLATNGLEIIDLASWRARILGGSSLLWHDVKAYERQLCQAALDICQKHAQLRLLRLKRDPTEFKLSGKTIMCKTTHRVKWRFVTEKEARTHKDYDHVVDLQSELASLNVPTKKDQKWAPWQV